MSRLSVGALAALLLALPFEPRQPTLPLFGVQLTLLEAVAAAATLALLVAHRDRLAALLRRPPLPLVLLWTYVAAHLLSATLAPVNRGLALKFVLRMAAAAVFAVAVAAAPRDVLRRSVPALTLAGAVVACLAILEGSGAAALDPFLDLFRGARFLIGPSRRASAGSENPNLAAALMLYGLVPAVGAAALQKRHARVVIPLVALFALGVLFTYSRGGLVALTVSVLALGLGLRRAGRAASGTALRATVTVLAVSVVFFAAGGSLRLPFSPRVPARAAHYAPGETFLALRPGEVRAVPLTITNTGRLPWSSGTLGCSWQRADAGMAMDWGATAACPFTAVPPVLPSDGVRVDATIRAPASDGRYLLVWDVVADGWVLSALGVSPAVVPVVVSRTPDDAQPFVPPVPAGAWERGRAPLWRAARAMWRERPLTGVGPDNFRWLYPRYSSAPPVGGHDPRIAANNVFLEAAATTGTIGLLALIFTLAATLRAAWRARSRAAPGSDELAWASVLFAWTTGIAVHGMVDSFLGFTAHYLFLGLVVGAASSVAPPRAAAFPDAATQQ